MTRCVSFVTYFFVITLVDKVRYWTMEHIYLQITTDPETPQHDNEAIHSWAGVAAVCCEALTCQHVHKYIVITLSNPLH